MCSKIEAMGEVLFYYDDDDLLLPNPTDLFNQLGTLITDTAKKIRGIMNQIEKESRESPAEAGGAA